MSHRWFALLALPLMAFDCGDVPDVRIGPDAGIPQVEGSTVIDVPAGYTCGTPISDESGTYTVTSSGDAASCLFKFAQDVTVLSAADYDQIPQLEGAQAINGIDLEVSRFAVVDPATGQFPPGVQSVDGKAFGVTILTEQDLELTPPFTKTIEGAPLDALKALVIAKQDVVIPLDITVAVALDPAPPAQLSIDFQAQPVLTVGF